MVNQECTICFKTFSSRSSLRRHMRRTHPDSEEACRKSRNAREKSVTCPLCRSTLNCYQALVEHLTQDHDLLMNEEAHDFLNTADFLKWKQQVEKVTESSFVKSRGTSAVKCVRGTKDVYVCHRSGRPRGKGGSRVRQPKSQGSQKLDAFCPARMKVVTTEGGRVFLNFLPVHVGHGADPAHLRLTPLEKEMLAKKMADKQSLDDILQEVHDSSEPQGRLRLLSKQDLQNISRDANLLAKVYSSNCDIDNWVTQQRQTGSILLYKPKGAEFEALSADDFILCLVNSRRDSPIEYVCLDSFESASSSDLNLFSISAANDSACAVAVMISNRKDTHILNLFLKEVASASHLDLRPCCLFRSRNNCFHNVWRTWFGDTITHCIGSWQIEHEWRVTLTNIVKNKLKKVEIFRAFKSLLEAPCEKDFRDMCRKIDEITMNESEDFKLYFREMSASYKDWVRFSRSSKLTEMNAIFEKLHRSLNSIYLRYKTFETIEVLATSVMEIMIGQQGGETRKAVREINARHKMAMKTECTITLEAVNLWKVLFHGPREETCTVEKADFSCKCQLKCEDCKFCQHAFRGTCLDCTKGNMCKHIHSICTSLFSDKEMTVEGERLEESVPDPETFEVIISEAVMSEEVEDGKLELQQDFSQILSMIRTVEDVTLVRNAFRLITPTLGLNKGTLPLTVDPKEEVQ